MQRQGKFEESVRAFEKSIELDEKLRNERGQAMVQNSPGGLLQRMGRLDEAVRVFEKSYELLVKLKDVRGQAMVHTAFGKALSRSRDRIDKENGLQHLFKGFEIDLKLKNKQGLKIVTPALVNALLKFRRKEEALDVYNRAAIIAPVVKRIEWLRKKLFPDS